MKGFTLFILSLQNLVSFTLKAHLNLDAKSSVTLDPYLEFIKLTVEKVDSQTQIVPNIL